MCQIECQSESMSALSEFMSDRRSGSMSNRLSEVVTNRIECQNICKN